MTSVDTELVLVALAALLSPVTLFLSVLALVVGERPTRTGLWFFFGAFGVTLVVGVIAAFALGNTAASAKPNTPKTWVAIVDLVAGALVLFVVVRLLRRPRDPKRVARMIDQMSKVASSPVIAIVAAGATLATPGALIPLALKDISETNPSTGRVHRRVGRFRARFAAPSVRRARDARRCAGPDDAGAHGCARGGSSATPGRSPQSSSSCLRRC